MFPSFRHSASTNKKPNFLSGILSGDFQTYEKLWQRQSKVNPTVVAKSRSFFDLRKQ